MARLAARLGTLALLAALLAPASRAQDPAGAEAAARAYSDAFAMGDWDAAAALTDPRDLARFSEFVGVFAEMAGDELDDSAPLAEADTPEAAFAAFMDLAISANPMMGDMMTSVQTEILGSVTEADTLVHVVTRTGFTLLGSDVSGLEVVTARWDGTRWVVKLNEQMEGMVAAMETAFEDPSVVGAFGAGSEPPTRDPKKQR